MPQGHWLALWIASDSGARACLSEVLGVDCNEHSRRCGGGSPVECGHLGVHEQLTALAPIYPGLESVCRPDQDRREVFDHQLASDSWFSDQVEQETVEVVKDGGDRAAVRDAGCAHVAIVEDVGGHHEIAFAMHAQVMAMRVVNAAAQALLVVSRQVRAIWMGADSLLQRSHECLKVSHGCCRSEGVPSR